MSKPSVSLMVHTASQDSFLSHHGIPSAVLMLLDTLEHQTFRDFELVYVDAHYETTRQIVAGVKPGFGFKHVHIHPAHRYWYDQGYTFISAAKNTGILYADGDLCVTCDDGEVFPPNLLEKYWSYYAADGSFMHAAHKRMRSIGVKEGRIIYPISGDVYCNDNRAQAKGEVIRHQNGSWMYAGTSFSMSAALALNGFNERMDGYKSLEDCDFGIRMTMVDKRFVLDKNAFFYILDHPSYVEQSRIGEFVPFENYGLVRCGMELNEVAANKAPITDAHLQIIKRETLAYRKFDPLAPENAAKMEIWKKTPCFDLAAQRQELRASSNWRW